MTFEATLRQTFQTQAITGRSLQSHPFRRLLPVPFHHDSVIGIGKKSSKDVLISIIDWLGYNSEAKYLHRQMRDSMAQKRHNVLKLASNVGVGKSMISVYETAFQNRWYQNIDTNIHAYYQNDIERRGQILIPFVYGFHTEDRNAFRTCILANAFRSRGYEPTLIKCQSDLPICRPKAHTHRQYACDLDNKSTCDHCNVNSTSTLDAMGFNALILTEILPKEYEPPVIEEKEDVVYRGIHISKFAKASTRRFSKKYTLDLDNGERDVYLRFLKAAALLIDAAECLFETHDYKATLVHNDRYVDQGVFRAVSEKHDVPGYSAGFGFRENTIMVGRSEDRVSLPWFSDTHYVTRNVLNKSLTEDQREEIEEIMEARFKGTKDGPQYAAITEQGFEGGNGTVLGMFTNLLWDASLDVDEIVFSNPLHWIDHTIEWVKRREDVTLVVKPHPAEIIHGTNESVRDRIYGLHAPLGDHIHVLEPDTDINPYHLVKDIDATLVFNSTIGLEAAFLGQPVIVAGETHYRDFGFTFDPSSIMDYERLLSEASSLEMDDEMQEQAIRYAHFLFVRKHVNFPPIPRDTKLSQDDMKIMKEQLDAVVERVIAGTTVTKIPLND